MTVYTTLHFHHLFQVINTNCFFVFISKTNRICKTFAYFCIKQTEEYHVYVFKLIPNNLYEVSNKMHLLHFVMTVFVIKIQKYRTEAKQTWTS